MASSTQRGRARAGAKRSARSKPERGAGLTHLDASSRPRMVDVGGKPVTHRIAEAEAQVWLPPPVARALEQTGHRTRKGPVFDTAIIAGAMAAKRTAELIPFCHPLAIEHCELNIDFRPGPAASATAVIRCRVEIRHKTGVEMEALTAATVAALTIYDMCKALSHDIRIEQVRLLSKSS